MWRFECVNTDCFVLIANLLPFGALKTSFSTVDECLMKAVWRGILSRLFYWGDETVALSGQVCLRKLVCLFFEKACTIREKLSKTYTILWL